MMFYSSKLDLNEKSVSNTSGIYAGGTFMPMKTIQVESANNRTKYHSRQIPIVNPQTTKMEN